MLVRAGKKILHPFPYLYASKVNGERPILHPSLVEIHSVLFQLLNFTNFPRLFILYDSIMNVFGLWTKQNI